MVGMASPVPTPPTRGHRLFQGWLCVRGGLPADGRPPFEVIRDFHADLNAALRPEDQLKYAASVYAWLACTAGPNRRVPGLPYLVAIEEISNGAVPMRAWNEPGVDGIATSPPAAA